MAQHASRDAAVDDVVEFVPAQTVQEAARELQAQPSLLVASWQHAKLFV